jgi:hypothetical protein
MVKRILDCLDSEESCALTSFLVEVLGLETEIRVALVEYYAAPDHREEFSEQFLDGMPLGRMVDRLRPAFDDIGLDDEERQLLSEMVEIRNVVAHRSPAAGYDEHEDFDITPYRVYETNLRVRSLTREDAAPRGRRCGQGTNPETPQSRSPLPSPHPATIPMTESLATAK